MMTGNAFWAYLHFVSIFVCVGALTSEWFLWTRRPTPELVRRLFLTDLTYGLAALALFGTGAVRAAYFEKGWTYYSSNPYFWTKVGIYFLIVALSAPPTLTFFSLKGKAARGESLEVTETAYRRVRVFIALEILAIVLLPLVAVKLARG